MKTIIKHRDEFSRKEADEIKQLLVLLRSSDDFKEQKLYRHRLRTEYFFYISDYTRKMTAAEFDLLIENRTIKIH